MSSKELRLQCKVCGLYYVQDSSGNLELTTEQRCQKMAEEDGESVVAYKFTCPQCERQA